MTKLTQPLKWHGGKYYLRSWIIGLMPPHLHYVEPFFGGGGILLARDPNRDWMAVGDEKLTAAEKGSSEVVNDLHGELINFWRVLQSAEHFEAFRQRVEMTPFSEDEFDQAKELSPDAGAASDRSPLERAVHFFILARQSRQGLMKDFATLSRNRTRGRVNEQASAWLNVVQGLPDVHQRLKGVVILNQNAVGVIRKQDGTKTLFYCDPPYVHETRATTGEYAFEMTLVEHEELLETLSAIQGKFMLSGYPSELYTKWERKHGWNRHEFLIDNKAASGKVKEKKTECLWCNF
ncbi:DNA adenine methylase [Allorhodopirellula heiligendammensis]|uniref:DNA adenine methylase n=1 Tax=Allorhodopirellula heiligendammensis TaxID=2714739 RepID=A0A5C6C4R8_9BACT|nr:DNA adenine methylase [Allorhodopirellula heiligendammensis]TWU18531.1 DNA adenine methylase [Allorhodopirellula heiligendammensis]